MREAIQSASGKPWRERRALFGRLQRRKAEIEQRRRKLGLPEEISWFVADRQGFQIWRDPYSAVTDGRNYAHRDYFHGNDTEHERLTLPDDLHKLERPEYQPISKPHISMPFRSEATFRYMVAISVPVWDEKGERVVGVLARTMHLGRLLNDYKNQIRAEGSEDVERVVALLDTRDGKLLDHPWMTPENLKMLYQGKGGNGQSVPQQRADPAVLPAEQAFARLAVSGRRLQQLRRLHDGRSSSGGRSEGSGSSGYIDRDAAYRDPVGAVAPAHFGGVWLAAFAPVGQTGWTAVVQERRRPAMKPVDDMRVGLMKYGFSALVVAGGLIVLLLFFVNRLLDPTRRVASGSISERQTEG